MTRSISTLGDVTGSYDVILCDVWGVLQQLRQQHGLSISGAAHHLMRLGAGLDPLPPLDHLIRTQRCAQRDGH